MDQLTCGNAEENTVKGLELGGVVQNGNVGGLGRRIHLRENFVRESLRDLEEGGIAASLADALQLSLGLRR